MLHPDRSLEKYFEKLSYLSENTIKKIRFALKTLLEFNPAHEQLLKNMDGSESVLWDSLQEWISWCQKTKTPQTIKQYYGDLETYLHYRGIKIDVRERKMNLRFPRQEIEEKYPLSLEEAQKIINNASYLRKGMYLTMISAGLPINEVIHIRKKDIDPSTKRPKIHVQARFRKVKRAKTTYPSIEASKYIMERMIKIDDENELWPSTVMAEIKYFERLVDRLNLGSRYDSTNRRKITTHSFRAYFITKLSRYDPNLAKMFAGQRQAKDLLVYDRLTDEEKLEHYLEFEKELLIFDNSKKDLELSKTKAENKTLQEIIKEIYVTLKEQGKFIKPETKNGQ